MGQIELKDIRKSFGGVEVIKGIDLQIDEGESSLSAPRAVANPPCCA